MSTREPGEGDPDGIPPPAPGGWRRASGTVSLPEVHGSVPVPLTGGFWRKMLAFAGPGYLVAVGYMDPGNWATDLAGGSRYGYTLLSVIMLSNLMAILLQALALRLGIGSGRDLAQACRDHYSRPSTHRLVAAVRAGDCGLRSRRSDRLGDRAEPALRPAVDVGRVPHVARRAARALPAAVSVPVRRGARRAADPRDRRVLRRAVVARRPEPARCGRRVRARSRRSSATPTCSTSPSGSSARR